MTIWVNEQIDASGIVYACIACCDEDLAKSCHESWSESLSEEQKKQGWLARIRTVDTWDEVPVNALKLN